MNKKKRRVISAIAVAFVLSVAGFISAYGTGAVAYAAETSAQESSDVLTDLHTDPGFLEGDFP